MLAQCRRRPRDRRTLAVEPVGRGADQMLSDISPFQLQPESAGGEVRVLDQLLAGVDRRGSDSGLLERFGGRICQEVPCPYGDRALDLLGALMALPQRKPREVVTIEQGAERTPLSVVRAGEGEPFPVLRSGHAAAGGEDRAAAPGTGQRP